MYQMIYRISINLYRYEYRIEKTDRYPALQICPTKIPVHLSIYLSIGLRRLICKQDKLYKRWTMSSRPYDHNKFLEQKHLVRRVSERSYEKYLGDILGLNNERDDQNMGEPHKGQNKETLLPSQALQAGLRWHCFPKEGWTNCFYRNG